VPGCREQFVRRRGPPLFWQRTEQWGAVNTSPAAGATKQALDGATLWPYESMIVGYGAHESMMLLRTSASSLRNRGCRRS
jgi:hypothetical protein